MNNSPSESNKRNTQTSAIPAFLNTVDRPKVTVVVPARNEEKNLPHVLPRIPAWVDEVILVDGHSKDKTVEVRLFYR